MCIWRAAYTVFLDPFSQSGAQALAEEARALREALLAAAALAAAGGAALRVAQVVAGQLNPGAF
jgi:hypothetical protein